MRSATGDLNTRTDIEPDERRPELPNDAPEMRFPGADRPAPPPDREDDLPERLGERIAEGPGGSGIATGESDLLPNVEIPESSM